MCSTYSRVHSVVAVCSNCVTLCVPPAASATTTTTQQNDPIIFVRRFTCQPQGQRCGGVEALLNSNRVPAACFSASHHTHSSSAPFKTLSPSRLRSKPRSLSTWKRRSARPPAASTLILTTMLWNGAYLALSITPPPHTSLYARPQFPLTSSSPALPLSPTCL